MVKPSSSASKIESPDSCRGFYLNEDRAKPVQFGFSEGLSSNKKERDGHFNLDDTPQRDHVS